MKKAIIGKKVGMTQIFDETGKVIPVTVVEAGPCVVTQKKTIETDGYVAVQLGFEDIKESMKFLKIKSCKNELGTFLSRGRGSAENFCVERFSDSINLSINS